MKSCAARFVLSTAPLHTSSHCRGPPRYASAVRWFVMVYELPSDPCTLDVVVLIASAGFGTMNSDATRRIVAATARTGLERHLFVIAGKGTLRSCRTHYRG
jgi:hypothetical protein